MARIASASACRVTPTALVNERPARTVLTPTIEDAKIAVVGRQLCKICRSVATELGKICRSVATELGICQTKVLELIHYTQFYPFHFSQNGDLSPNTLSLGLIS